MLSNGRSTLDGALNDSDLNFNVADGSSFPATGSFEIVIDTELMTVTRSGNAFTASARPDAVAHDSGVFVGCVLTAENLAIHDAGHPTYPFITAPTLQDVSAWTWKNQQTVTISALGHIDGGSYNTTGSVPWTCYHDCPATFTAYLTFRTRAPIGTSTVTRMYLGFAIIDTSTNRTHVMGVMQSSAGHSFTVADAEGYGSSWSSPTYYTVHAIPQVEIHYLKLVKDGSNFTFYHGLHPDLFNQIRQFTLTTHNKGAASFDKFGISGEHIVGTTWVAPQWQRQMELIRMEGF